MARIITHAEVAAIPDGGELFVEEGAALTPLAAERITARSIKLRQGTPTAATAGDTAAAVEAAARQVLQRLGDRLGQDLGSLPADLRDRIASEVLAAMGDRSPPAPTGLPPAADYCATYLAAERQHARRRAVLTATGRNQKGIVAHLTAIIAEHGGDILDISQTLVGDYFTMLLIVDISEMDTGFETLKQALQTAAQARGVQAILMHEDIVSSMHRV